MPARYIESQCSRCLQVSLVSADRCLALRRLIRPQEVAGYVQSWSGTRPGWVGTANMGGRWLGRAFDERFLRYAPDLYGRDVWCSPAITVKRGGGDCDDLAILAASLLIAAGIDAGVAVGTICGVGGVCGGHAWVEGTDERGWFLLEATTGDVFRTAQSRYHPAVFAMLDRCVAVAV